jgi:aldehyde:ferredoxin oxidoreductase
MIAARYIKIDLTQMKSQPYPIPAEDQRKFVGGRRWRARILYRETPAGVDPLVRRA